MTRPIMLASPSLFNRKERAKFTSLIVEEQMPRLAYAPRNPVDISALTSYA